MNDLDHLFQDRRKKAFEKGGRYALAIARTLNLFPALFAILVLVLYRKLLEEWLPPDFPVAWLLAVILTPVLASTRFRTFIQPADPFFLAPAPDKLTRYWQRTFTYNATIQCLAVLGWMAFLSPLFIQRLGDGIAWVMAVVVLITFKVFLLWLRLHELFGKHPRWIDPVIRWVTSALVTIWLFQGEFFGIPLLAALGWTGFLILHHRKRRPPQGYIPWDRLVSEESATVTRYYRLASQFIDVPQVGNEVRIRRGWGWLNRFPARRPEHTYLYLYQRTFLRYREPFGVSLRLTLVTGLALIWAEFSLSLAASLYFLGLWMTAVQLPWIRRIHRFQPWFRLYPLPEQQKTLGLSRLVWIILLAQSLLILVLPALTWEKPFPSVPLLLAGGWTFSTVYARWRIPRSMRKRKAVSTMRS
ncbi:ABC transporter permease [Desmospora profundinema]|uniref:ABC-2 type transport system permease protein n=1 Tax=Desmospora profundinema TaxID=1571184 RepID=A0ABU1INZ2_9BACL|nr:ABC transporter permease [Desmospora profundinema]MDR6226431.1 ABC-2 type transport system permease protein [Desmospora profundinema]